MLAVYRANREKKRVRVCSLDFIFEDKNVYETKKQKCSLRRKNNVYLEKKERKNVMCDHLLGTTHQESRRKGEGKQKCVPRSRT